MDNPLDEIYEKYKKGIGPGERKPMKRIIGPGVPSPILEGETEQDFSGIRGCGKCGSMNVSICMSTNKTVCNDCKGTDDKPNKVNFQREMEQLRESEIKKVEEQMRRGDQFFL